MFISAGSAPSFQRLSLLRLALCVFLILSLTAPVLANRPGFDSLDLVVDEPLLIEIADLLDLSDEQRRFATHIHTAYFEQIRQLETDTTERLHRIYADIDALEAEIVDRHDPASYEPLAALWNEAYEFSASARRRADLLLENWFSELTPILADSQLELLPAAQRVIRRRNLLASRRDDIRWAAFHHPINVLALLDEAMSEDGELAGLLAPSETGRSLLLDKELEAIREEMATIRAAHDLAIDVVLRRRLHESRFPKRFAVEDAVPYSDDSPKGRKRARQWYQLHQVRDQTVRLIAEIARDRLGVDSAAAWEERFWATLMPDVIRDLWIVDAFEWTLDATRLAGDDESAAAILSLKAQFLSERHELRRRAYQEGVRACRRWGSARGLQPEQLRYARAVYALNRQHEEYTTRLHALLPDPVIMDRYTESLEVARSANAGIKHPIDPVMLEALGHSP
jgi:hypothetical protein